MKLQLGNNEILECESVEVDFIDGTRRMQMEDYLYINPSTIKSLSVKGLK